MILSGLKTWLETGELLTHARIADVRLIYRAADRGPFRSALFSEVSTERRREQPPTPATDDRSSETSARRSASSADQGASSWGAGSSERESSSNWLLGTLGASSVVRRVVRPMARRAAAPNGLLSDRAASELAGRASPDGRSASKGLRGPRRRWRTRSSGRPGCEARQVSVARGGEEQPTVQRLGRRCRTPRPVHVGNG